MKFKVGQKVIVTATPKDMNPYRYKVGDVYIIHHFKIFEKEVIYWSATNYIGCYEQHLKLFNPSADEYNKMCFKLLNKI